MGYWPLKRRGKAEGCPVVRRRNESRRMSLPSLMPPLRAKVALWKGSPDACEDICNPKGPVRSTSASSSCCGHVATRFKGSRAGRWDVYQLLIAELQLSATASEEDEGKEEQQTQSTQQSRLQAQAPNCIGGDV